MSKRALLRVTEPDENLIHYDAYPGADAVTLCGRTDWIGVTHGKPTRATVTCIPCREIENYIRNSRRTKSESQS